MIKLKEQQGLRTLCGVFLYVHVIENENEIKQGEVSVPMILLKRDVEKRGFIWRKNDTKKLQSSQIPRRNHDNSRTITSKLPANMQIYTFV